MNHLLKSPPNSIEVFKSISTRPIFTAQRIWSISSWKRCTLSTFNSGDYSIHGEYLLENGVTHLYVSLLPCLARLSSTLLNDAFTYCSDEIVHHILPSYNDILESVSPRYMSGSSILSFFSFKYSCILLIYFPGSTYMQSKSS